MANGSVVESDATSLRRAIESSLAHLTPLQRQILERADMEGERQADVYDSLNISRRTFYRQRAAALDALAHLLRNSESSEISVSQPEACDALDAQLGLSRALEQVGDWRKAAFYLEELAEASDDPETAFWLNLRLADVYLEAGRSSQADSKMRATEGAARYPGLGQADTRAIVEIFEAKSALTSDHQELARKLLTNALPKIRAMNAGGAPRRVIESLIQGLLLKNELAHYDGAFALALECANEAERLCRRSFVSAVLETRSQTMSALSRAFLWKEPLRAERDLMHCHGRASTAGYTYEAASVAAYLSGLYRTMRRPDKAYAVAHEALSSARMLGPSLPLTLLLLEWARASFGLNRTEETLLALSEMKSCPFETEKYLAVGELLETRILLARGQYRDALHLAERLEQRFVRMGRRVYTGSALVAQAEALYALGCRKESLRIIRVAAEILTTSGHPVLVADVQKMLTDPRRIRASNATR